MAEEKKILIPGRLKNAAVGGHVAGTEDIYDDNTQSTQQEINAQHEAALNAPSTGVIARLETLEGEVAFSGDFEAENNPSGIVSGGEKITTTNAVNGALDYAGYFECSSNADAVTKAVLNTGYALRNGGCIKIKMTNANTADNVKLKLGNADAKDLYYDGSRVGSGNSWKAGEVIEVYYDGTAFYANNISGGGKFATGEKVKEINIEEEPTEGSTNLVTSGGVYSQLVFVETVCDDFTNAEISYVGSYVTLTVQNGNTLVYNAEQTGSRAFIKFPVTLVVGKIYVISFDYVHSYNKTVYMNFSNGAGTTGVVTETLTGLSGRKVFQYTHRSDVTGFYIPSTDINADNTLTLSNFTISEKSFLLDEVGKLDERVTEIERKSNFDIVTIEDFSNAEVSQTDARVNISLSDGVVTIEPANIGLRAFVKFPEGLIDGKQYVLMFDYAHSVNKSITINYSNSVGGTSKGSFIITGLSGHADNTFTKTSDITGLFISTTDIGVDGTLVMSNFKIVQRGDAEYYINEIKEDGKTVNSNLASLNIESDYIPFIAQEYKSNVEWGVYIGKPLMGNRFGHQIMLNTGSQQGAALYGETAFCLNAQGGTFGWYNVRTGAGRWVNGNLAKDCPFLSTPDSGWHCNSAQFSDIFYDDSDKFPLLYISGSEGTKASMFLVARIVSYKDKYTYHMELVQTVTMPASITYANIGIENGYLYMQSNTNIYKCAVPAIFDGNGDVIPTVSMVDADILDTMTGVDYPSTPQGCCVHEGVFIGTYGGISGNRYIATYDLTNKQPINTINIYSLGIDEEPEGVFFYKETLILWGSRNMYRLWI